MVKRIAKLFSALGCMLAIVLVLGLNKTSFNANATVYNYTPDTLTYAEHTIKWSGFDRTYTYTIRDQDKTWISIDANFSGIGDLPVIVKKNTSTYARTGYVYANKSGKRVATLKIVQNGHSHVYYETGRVEATCTTNGTIYKKCSICNKEITETIGYTGHDNKPYTVVKQPTCGSAGLEERVCHCGYRETRPYGQPTGKHEYSDKWKVTKKPTCSTNGVESCYCKVCNKEKTRTICKYGHVYEQIDRKDPNNKMTGITLKCDRCNDITHTIAGRSDVILAYERYNDKKKSLYDDAKTLFCYKRDYIKYNGNDGVDTYLLCYSYFTEYQYIWNNCIPNNVRHIYDYGHEYGGGSHEFNDVGGVLMSDILTNKKLKRKTNVLGDVYIFTCHAGDWEPFNDLTPKFFKSADKQFSTLKAYAYLCPDTNVIGVKDAYCSYDGGSEFGWLFRLNFYYKRMNGLLGYLRLPAPNSSDGYFALEYYDSDKEMCNKTMNVGKSIYGTNFTESYL